MLIKVTSKEACEKIATLLRPSLRSVPKYIDIYPLGVYHGQVLMHWKNNAVTTVQIGIAQLNICKDSVEIIFMRVTGKEPHCRFISEKPIVIPIEYE